MLDAHAALSPITGTDFRKLIELDAACASNDEAAVQTIMIGYFEKRPPIIYVLAQSLLAQCYGWESP